MGVVVAAVEPGEQGVWRAVHVAAASADLNGGQVSRLRIWAGERMRVLPFAVFEPDGYVRVSFVDAIEIAAQELIDGRVPQ